MQFGFKIVSNKYLMPISLDVIFKVEFIENLVRK